MTQDNSAFGASQEARGMVSKKLRINPARPINCDQVIWMLNAIGRYLPPSADPGMSRAREMKKYALLYEIMEVAHLHFEDDAAQHNGTPPDVRLFRYASKQEEARNQCAAAAKQIHQDAGDVIGGGIWGGPEGRRE